MALMKKDCSTEENALYVRACSSTRRGYRNAIDLLRRRNLMPDATLEEQFNISAEITEKKAALGKQQNRQLAFQAGTHPIKPPTEDEVTAIKDLADRVAKLTTDGQALKKSIALTGEIAASFAKIQSKP
jgi:hypothetical protein